MIQMDSRPEHSKIRSPVSFLSRLFKRRSLSGSNCGAISLSGRVGTAEPPHIVLPLTIEPTKPQLCHKACSFKFLDVWYAILFGFRRWLSPLCTDRYTYQTVLDDKSATLYYLKLSKVLNPNGACHSGSMVTKGHRGSILISWNSLFAFFLLKVLRKGITCSKSDSGKTDIRRDNIDNVWANKPRDALAFSG